MEGRLGHALDRFVGRLRDVWQRLDRFGAFIGPDLSYFGWKTAGGFTYELFLDENGEKISKSRGNGLSVEEWLEYATPESLALYMYNSPKKAKRLYF